MKKPLLYSLLCLGSILAPVLIASAPAHAYSVTLNGRTGGNPGGQPLYDINLTSGDVGRTLDPFVWRLPAAPGRNTVDLAATAIFRLVSLTANQLSLDITLTNNTVQSYQAAILSFGFGVSPDASRVVLVQQGTERTVFDKAEVQSTRGNNPQSFPGEFKNIDICIYAANNCSGGNINQGLQAGQSDAFRLNIFGNFGRPDGTASVTLSDMPLKFQTQDGSYQLAAVPEPITVIGSGLALGFGAVMRREVSRKQKKLKVKA